MRRKLLLIFLGLFLAGWTAPVLSQTPDLFDSTQKTSRLLVLILLGKAEIQNELNLSDQQKDDFRKVADERRSAQRKLPRVFDFRELQGEAREKYNKESDDIRQAEWQASWAILNDVQRTRLTEIHLQRLGNLALDLPPVLHALKASDEQRAKIQASQSAFQEAEKNSLPVPRDATPDQRALHESESQRRVDKRNAEYKAVFTAEQIAAFEAMKGKPFTFMERFSRTTTSARKTVESATALRLDITLITEPEIQRELKFTSKQTQNVKSLMQENALALQPDPNQPGNAPRLRASDPEFLEHARKYFDNLQKVLDAKQTERLAELSLQKRGASALHDTQVATRLKLTEEQRTQLRRIRFDAHEPTEEHNEKMRQAINDRDVVKMKQLLGEQRQRQSKIDAESLKVLTEEQRAAFEAMQGKKFEFPDPANRLRNNPAAPGKVEST